MKRLFASALLLSALLVPVNAGWCVYCQGGGPCASDAECSVGCRCLNPPYQAGVCISQ